VALRRRSLNPSASGLAADAVAVAVEAVRIGVRNVPDDFEPPPRDLTAIDIGRADGDADTRVRGLTVTGPIGVGGWTKVTPFALSRSNPAWTSSTANDVYGMPSTTSASVNGRAAG
jgi:hypothetical protein